MKGIVIKSTSHRYKVKFENGQIADCYIRGKFRLSGFKSTNPITVGDHVQTSRKADGSYVISAIETRKNYIIRRATKLSKRTHIIASNIDQVVLMASLRNPKTLTPFIDRFFVVAEAYSIPAVLFFNKTDIYTTADKSKLDRLIKIYNNIGYPCFSSSLLKKRNVDKTRKIFNNKISLISGQSGVGKTTLLNMLQPDLNLKTDIISSAFKTGKHRTTFAQMYEIGEGGYIIDTPGIKSFGVVDFGKEELFHYFKEIFEQSAHCKYNNCIHEGEPGCAVYKAVEEGKISIERYSNYLDMLKSDDIV